jgi:transcriptional regulator with XRE-family HTH domain
MDNNHKKIPNLIKTLRKEAGLTQEELAFKCGFNRTYISMIERSVRSPSIKTIENICGAIDLKISQFFEFLENYED